MDSPTRQADDSPTAAAAEKPYPSIKLCMGYGVGTAGTATMLNTVSVYFPALMTTVLGISPIVAGALLMFTKIFDAITDVIIGASSDKTNSRWGKRRPYLFVGAIISFFSLLMIFVAPVMGETQLIIYMAIALVIYSTGYSLFNVPYLALPADITRGNKERLKLISFRTAFIGIGQLIALALSAWLIDLGGGGTAGYRLMGIVMACFVLFTMLSSFFGTASGQVVDYGNKPHKLTRADLKTLLENRPLFILLGAKLAQYVSFGVLMPVTLLFLLNVMSVGYTGMIHLSVVQNVTVFASMPVWTRIGRKLGKRNAYLLAQAIMIPTVITWFWADASSGMPSIWWRAVLFGFASGGALLMSTSMLPDTIEFDRLKNGIERGGVFASLYSVNEKLGFAIGAAALGLSLSIGGYIATTDGEIIVQSARTITSLYLIKTVVPACMLMIGVSLLIFYNLDDEKLERLRAEKTTQ